MSNDNSGTALVLRNTVEPSTMAELKDFAVMAASSSFFGVASPEQALIVAMAGKDLGFSYTQALRAFHIVKGKPTLSADGMVGAILGRPDLCDYFRPVRVTDPEAAWVTKPVGAEPIEYRFTMEDAQRAGLVNDMYKKHPKRMLSARCKAYLARDVYPQILMGLVTDDEAEEIARPASRVVESVVVDSAVAGLTARIESAQSQEELGAVALEIKRAGLGEWDLGKMRSLYARRMEALAPPPAVMREPGEEG